MKNVIVKPLSFIYPIGVFLLVMLSWISVIQAKGLVPMAAMNRHLDPENRTPSAFANADKNSCDHKAVTRFEKPAVCSIDGAPVHGI
jgi:hypothetical protein